MKEHYKIRHGGLMRCCLLTIDVAMELAAEPPKEGDTLTCSYCKNTFGILFTNGAWQWGKPREDLLL